MSFSRREDLFSHFQALEVFLEKVPIIGSFFRKNSNHWNFLFWVFLTMATPVLAQATFDDALNKVVTEVLDGKTKRVEVSALRTQAKRGRVQLQTWGNRVVEQPWDNAWVFMVDDAPLANWAHPCRYVFVSADLSDVVVQNALTPLEAVAAGGTRSAAVELDVVIPFDFSNATDTKKKRSDARARAIRYDGSVSNCYAVIVSGGYNKANNHIRYWGDVAHIYSTLSLKYGYPKTNIYALVSDGLDPADDRSDDTNSPWDLDGDGTNDTQAAATAGNISNVFVHLQSILTTNDQLFVYLTDHGGPTEGGGEWDVELNLWNQEVLRDADLKALTTNFACPVLFTMEQCYGGGFLDDLNQSNRLIATAAHYDESSYAGNTFPWFDQWAYHWTAAMRGFYPQTNAPWIDAEPCDADLNGDGFVSFGEANDYAYANKYALDHPMYQENPTNMGRRSFLAVHSRDAMGMTGFALNETPPVMYTGRPVPLNITAQNVWGDTMTNYTGTLHVFTEAQPIDPGTYAGGDDGISAYPLNTTYMDCRVQTIYPPEVFGPARTLDSLQLNVLQTPTLPMSNLTIRLKHTAMTEYPTNPVWETEGWTTVYVSNLLLTTTGWYTFAFNPTFNYDGTNSLMVDFSLHNEEYDNGGGFSMSRATTNVSVAFVSDNEHGEPLTWSNDVPQPYLSTEFPRLRFGPSPIPVHVPVTPTNLVDFSSGVCTGAVSLLNTAAVVRLWVADATNAAWKASTEWFEIQEGSCSNFADATHAPQFSWTTGGDADWFAQYEVVRDYGPCAAQAGTISNDASSWIQTEVTGNGMISFYWKVSSEEGWDFLQFRINGAHQYQMSGEVDWQQRQYEISGVSTLRWVYAKDESSSEGDDTGWMTDFEFLPFTGRFVQVIGELDFGRIEIGDSLEKTIQVANRGDEELTVSNITLPEYFAATPTNFMLTAGETNTVTVTFTPLADGVFTGICAVISDAQSGFATLPVSGEGFISTHRYVWTNSPSPSAPYTNWITAAHVIQDALDVASRDDIVWVTNGVYDTGGAYGFGQTNRIVVSTGIVVRSINGPAVTHIVGAADPSATNELGLGSAAVRGVLLMSNSVLDGFTVRGSRTTLNGYGGGVASDGAILGRSSPFDIYGDLPLGRITNCVISGNAAKSGGGGAFFFANNSIIQSNAAQSGGGTAIALVHRCEVRDNVAQQWGGGMAMSFASACRITGNTATMGGGVYVNRITRNCVISGNTATEYGGGVLAGDLIESSTIVGNRATTGGGIWQTRAINCVIAHNDAIYGADYADCEALTSCVTTTNGTVESTTNTLFADPLIVSLNDPHLLPDSPARDAGTNVAWMTDSGDIDDEARLNGVLVDIGADEFWANGLTDTLQVAVSLPLGAQVTTGYPLPIQAGIIGRCEQTRWSLGDGTFLTNEAVFTHTFAATGNYEVTLWASNLLGEVSSTVTVRVWDAVYYVAPDGNDAADGLSWTSAKQTLQGAVDACNVPGGTIWATNGVYDAGGRAMNDLSNRVLITLPVTLRSVNGPSVTTILGASDLQATNRLGFGSNAVRCVALQQSATLSGFTLSGGRTLEAPSVVYSQQTMITQVSGGGVFCDSFLELITNCVITNCAAKEFAGGVWRGRITHTTIQDNESESYGGGAYDSQLSHCRIVSNRARFMGGLFNGEAVNSLFVGNTSMGQGGAAYNTHLKSCTVVNNSSGISQGSAVNCIVYDNAGGNWGTDESTNYTYTCTTPLPSGTGCFDGNPMLSSNYTLTAASPCINAGFNEDWMTGATDLDGSNRVIGGTVDMGAFESDLMPGDLSASFIGGVGLTWHLPQGVASCAVYRAETDTLPGEPFAMFAATNAWADATTLPGQCYYYWVQTFTGDYASPISDAVYICTPALPANTHFVWVGSQNPQAPYTNWLTAATNIQDAVDIAQNGSTVLVGDGEYAHGWANDPDDPDEGIYLKNRVFITNDITVRSLNGALVTTIQGEGPSGTGAVRCVYMRGYSTLDGFALLDGHVAQEIGFATRRNHTGGGVFMEDNALVTNCLIARCDGSGVANWNGGQLVDSTISYNTGINGGGLLLTGEALVEHCRILNNTATAQNGERGSGGGAYLAGTPEDGSPVMRNCFLSGNLAASQRVGGGGGVLLDGGHLYYCTIANNRSLEFGGGLFVGGSAITQQVVNCIVYHNSAPYGRDVYVDEMSSAPAQLTYNCVAETLPGTGNITNDPLLGGIVNEHIMAASPCRGAGNPAVVLAGETDIDGEPRLGAPNLVDIGCDQYHAEAINDYVLAGFRVSHTNVVIGAPFVLQSDCLFKMQHFVWSFNTGAGEQHITNAWEIRPVFTNAGTHSIVITATNLDGEYVYTGTVTVAESFTNYVSKTGAHIAPFTSWSNAATNVQAAIDACYAGGVTLITTGTYYQGATLRIEKPMTLRPPEELDGDQVVLHGENAYGVLFMDDAAAVVQELALKHGKASQGGGALVYAGTLQDCNVEENSAERFGGGVRAFGDARIEGCFIFRNTVNQFGGGIYADDRATVERCNISQNTSREGGGGVWLDQDAALINSFISGNRAYGGGGVAFYTGGTMRNCTITFNIAEGYGGGVWHGLGETRNCIIYYNEAPDGADNHKMTGEVVVNYCLTTPDVTGTGNITDAEPLLAGRLIPNILPASAARNAGDSAGIGLAELDIDLEPRLQNGLVDIGCDEVTVTNMIYPLMVRITGDLTTIADQPVELWSDGFGRPETLIWTVGGQSGTTTFTDVSYITPTWEMPGYYPVTLTASNLAGPFSQTVTVHVVEAGFVNYVSPSGLHMAPFTNWFYAATNVQDAIKACPEGGTTLIGPGRYVLLDPLYVDKHMTLAGVPAAEHVVLDADGNGRVMAINHTNAFIHTLTLTGGADTYAAGIELLAGTVSNVTITGNTASSMYGGVNMGGNALLTHSTIISNKAASYAGGRASGFSRVQHCEFLFNESDGDCGGLGLEHQAHAEDCTLTANLVHMGGGGGLYFNQGGSAQYMALSSNAASQGAGVYFHRGGTLRYSAITKGWAFFYGGGAWLSGGGLMELCFIRDNFALTVAPYGKAGGVVLDRGGILRDCYVAENQANHVGGVYVQGDGLIDDCDINQNLATNISIDSTTHLAQVGGVFLNGGEMRHSIVRQNISQGDIGGLQLTEDAEVRNSIIANNTAADQFGGVALFADGSPIIRNSTIAYNSANALGGLYIEDDGTVINTIAHGNTADGQPSEYMADGAPMVVHLFTNDPQFVSTTNLRLQASSTCINAGTNEDWMTGATDFDGNPRIIGPATDIGAYEYPLTPTNLVAANNAPSGCLQLTWSVVNGATGYLVYRTDGSATNQLESTVFGSFSDCTAVKGIHYLYWIAADYGTEISAASATAEGWLRKSTSLEWLLLLLNDAP
ncbi:MAG: PKD domain-containing protein [Spartobacteria bacterium]|nr:PKD domain-containing protein [Spartobacteria bacterium]